MLRKPALVYPRGTYRIPQFHFRGGDVYVEPEYRESEVKMLRDKIRQTQDELNELRSEYSEVSTECSSCESYVKQLADKKGGESENTGEQQRLMTEISRLNHEINGTNEEIRALKRTLDPARIEDLRSQHAEFIPEFSLDDRDQVLFVDYEGQRLAEIVDATTSQRYLYSVLAQVEHQTARQTCSKLRSHTQTIRNKINQQPSNKNGPRTYAMTNKTEANETLDPLQEEKVELKLELDELSLQYELDSCHHRNLTNALYQYAGELNRLLEELGLEIEDLEDVRPSTEHQREESPE